MTLTHLQYLILTCLATLSFSANLHSTLFSEKGFRIPVRNLDYKRPSSAIPFNTDNKGAVVVNVDFGSDYAVENGLRDPPTMLLEISSAQTMLNTQSSLFTKYACPMGTSCYLQSPTDMTHEAFWSFYAMSGTPTVSIPGTNWTTEDNVVYLISSNFNDGNTYLTGTQDTYGWIGLAIPAFDNFPDSLALFSIYIEDVNSGDGWILFDRYLEWTTTSTPLLTLPTGPTWELTGVQFTLNGQSGPSESCAAIFDLQYGKLTGSSMALPSDSFNFLIQTLASLSGMTCTQESCTYSGADVNSLPSIGLLGMNIPASVYMTNTDICSYQSNFAVYDTNWNGADSIVVLGWKVMSQYYFVFQASYSRLSSNLILYPRHSNASQIDNSNTSNNCPEAVDSTQPEPTGNNSTINDSTSEAANTTQPDSTGDDSTANNDTSEATNTNNGTINNGSSEANTTQSGEETNPNPAGDNTEKPKTDDASTGSSSDLQAKDSSNSKMLSIILAVISMLLVGLVVYCVNKNRSIRSSDSDDENNVQTTLRSSEMVSTSSQILKTQGNSTL